MKKKVIEIIKTIKNIVWEMTSKLKVIGFNETGQYFCFINTLYLA